MKTALLPKNETARLAALKEYNILDTLAEKAFDQLTELASSVCGVPIALVSLIDEKRQWFKSHHGLDAQETPRDIAFCDHAINQDSIFEINIPTNFVNSSPVDFGLISYFASANAIANNNFDSLLIPFRCLSANISKT